MQTDATPGVGAGSSDDTLEALGPEPNSDKVRMVTIDGKPIEIRPMRMRQIRAFSPHAKPLIEWINSAIAGKSLDAILASPTLFFELQEAHGETLNRATAIAAGIDFETVEGLDPDVWLELVVKVWAANLDFFVHRLLPAVAGVMREQAGVIEEAGTALLRGRGLIRSKPSSEPATS